MFPHIMCPFDEILTVLVMLPFIGIFIKKIFSFIHAKTHPECHEDSCNHVEHTEEANEDQE